MTDLWVGLMTGAPELLISFSLLSLLVTGLFLKKNASPVVTGLAVTTLFGSAIWLLLFSKNGLAFGSAFILDPFARFMKILVLMSAVGTLILSVGFSKMIHPKEEKFEYPVLILAATLGMMLMASSNDMLGLYLALELQSLAFYVMVAMDREEIRSTEAGVKYFVLGALSSGMLLYGISLIYGYTGQTGFESIALFLKEQGISTGLIFGLVFLLSGLAFKVSAAPFHMWTPDVYEGSSLPVTTFLATASKIAAIALFVRVVAGAFSSLIEYWQPVIMLMAIASMLTGAFGAIGQKDFKRLLAYASIGQIGYPLACLSAGSLPGLEALLIHVLVYLGTALGTFALLCGVQSVKRRITLIEDFSGISHTHPLAGVFLTIFMFSFAGIPPLAGFWAKWSVLLALLDRQLYWVVGVIIFSSVVSAFYYLRIIRVIWFSEPSARFPDIAPELRLVAGACACFVVFYVLFADIIHKAALNAVHSFF